MVLETGLYETLQVYSGATQEKISLQFRRLVRENGTHPDKNGGEVNATHTKLTDAYNILKDPVTRRIYDEEGMRGIRHMNQHQHQKIKQESCGSNAAILPEIGINAVSDNEVPDENWRVLRALIASITNLCSRFSAAIS